MFRGNFPTKIDMQGRIKIPAAHRTLLEDQYGPEVYVTSLTGRNILIYPLLEWETIEAKMLEPPKMLPVKVKFLRNTSYYGQVGSMDKQGRILIPAHLREASDADGQEVAVMGNLSYLEVWNKERFRSQMENDPFTDEDSSDLAELGI